MLLTFFLKTFLRDDKLENIYLKKLKIAILTYSWTEE